MPEKIAEGFYTVLGFLGTLCIGVFGYGKLHNRVEATEKAVQDIKNLFEDSDHNPRLMTVKEHEKICNVNGELIFKELSQIKNKQNDNITRDTELFSRLRAIEDSTLKMSLSFDKWESSRDRRSGDINGNS